MNHISLTRHELYRLVWQESIPALSRRYKVSDYALRKACIKENIPIPKAGYWQNVRLGRALPIPPLPDPELNPQVHLHETPKKIETDSAFPTGKERVPSKLFRPDKLTVFTKDCLHRRKKEKWGIQEGLVKAPEGCLDINVSPQNIDRALRLMDAFIKGVQQSKGEVYLENNTTKLLLDGIDTKISLKEKQTRKVTDRLGKGWKELVPTGKLAFRLGPFYVEREWVDDGKTLEEKLPAILRYVEEWVNRKKEEKRLLEISWAKQAEKERLRKAEAERVEAERARFQQLMESAIRWNQAQLLRRYLKAYEQKALHEGCPGEEVKEYINWAQRKVDWLDPLNERDDPDFAGVDRVTLQTRKEDKPLWYGDE